MFTRTHELLSFVERLTDNSCGPVVLVRYSIFYFGGRDLKFTGSTPIIEHFYGSSAIRATLEFPRCPRRRSIIYCILRLVEEDKKLDLYFLAYTFCGENPKTVVYSHTTCDPAKTRVYIKKKKYIRLYNRTRRPVKGSWRFIRAFDGNGKWTG